MVTLVFLAFILLLKKKIVSLFLAALVFVAARRLFSIAASRGCSLVCGLLVMASLVAECGL